MEADESGRPSAIWGAVIMAPQPLITTIELIIRDLTALEEEEAAGGDR